MLAPAQRALFDLGDHRAPIPNAQESPEEAINRDISGFLWVCQLEGLTPLPSREEVRAEMAARDAALHVEFWTSLNDGEVMLGTARLGPDGTVIFTDAPDQHLPSLLTDPDRQPLMSDHQGRTFLTPAHGARFLWALPSTFRGITLLAVLQEGDRAAA